MKAGYIQHRDATCTEKWKKKAKKNQRGNNVGFKNPCPAWQQDTTPAIAPRLIWANGVFIVWGKGKKQKQKLLLNDPKRPYCKSSSGADAKHAYPIATTARHWG
jgi:hypothetical protein